MPIYEYVCTSCGHQLEALQKITEDPLVYCPECGEHSLRKKVSAAAFRLKGTGWYATDFKDAKKPAAGGEKGEAGKGDGSGDGKGDKPAASGDGKAAKAGKDTPAAPAAGSAGSE